MIWIVLAAYVWAVCRFFTGPFRVNRVAWLIPVILEAAGTKVLANGQPFQRTFKPGLNRVARRAAKRSR